MAGVGQAPKPDADRIRRNAPTFGWVELPSEGRQGPPPDLPEPAPWLAKLDGWPVATRAEWKRMWSTPQASQWDPTGISLHEWATQHAFIQINGPTAAGLAELRQIADRHGLSPRALLQLRWRISTQPAEASPTPAPTKRSRSKATDRKARILKIIEGGADASPEG